MLALSSQLLIVTAGALVGIGVDGEKEFGRESAAQSDTDAEHLEEMAGSWDVRFLQHCGFWSHYDHRLRTSNWPIPALETVEQLALFAAEQALLRESPMAGDIFLQYARQRKSFVHAGLVVAVDEIGYSEDDEYFVVYTIEGDTDHVGRLRGGRAMRVRRRLVPAIGDRFVRWTEMGRSRRIATPGLDLVAAALERGA
jgi:hypothetical protein